MPLPSVSFLGVPGAHQAVEEGASMKSMGACEEPAEESRDAF